MEPCDSSIIKLLDEAGELLCTIVEGDGEVGEMLLVLFIPRGTLCKSIIFFVHPLLKYWNTGFKSLDFLPMDIISNPDGGSKAIDNGLELVWGWIRCGSEDILHRGGREGEPPGVGGGENNACNLFSDFTDLNRIVLTKAKMSREMVSGLFRG